MKYDEFKDKFINVGREAKKGGDSLIFDYFYEEQSEAFSFYRTPQVFYTDERFRGLSSDAKTLYGILLDRVSLSRKNGCLDDEGRVFVYMTVRSIETALG